MNQKTINKIFVMQTEKPNPKKVNPYDSKAYKRSNGYNTTNRPNPRSVNPYSVKGKKKSTK